jgi:scaffold protein (connect acetoacetyl-CoA thiolase and HMG-CoA synthase)
MPSPAYARETPQRYRMEAGRCTTCGSVAFPPKKTCPRCRHDRVERFALPDEGTVTTWTVIHAAPDAFEMQTPYVLAIVDLGGVGVTAQVVDCDPGDLSVGCKVRRTLRRISTEGKAGIIHYGYKFVLA